MVTVEKFATLLAGNPCSFQVISVKTAPGGKMHLFVITLFS
jgi:hypothetical protein